MFFKKSLGLFKKHCTYFYTILTRVTFLFLNMFLTMSQVVLYQALNLSIDRSTTVLLCSRLLAQVFKLSSTFPNVSWRQIESVPTSLFDFRPWVYPLTCLGSSANKRSSVKCP